MFLGFCHKERMCLLVLFRVYKRLTGYPGRRPPSEPLGTAGGNERAQNCQE